MMGYNKLCLLLLLSSCTLAQDTNDNNEQNTDCPWAPRFKLYKKYLYQYTTESRNGVVGTSDLRNGPKLSCQVEIEVPEICRFNMHTRGCALTEVSAMDPQGQPVYTPAPGSDAFQAAMEKNPLSFSVEGASDALVYSEDDEPVNILNIKRGIASALLVPVLEEDQTTQMSTVHGNCLTDYVINSRKDTATDVTLHRDLSQCTQFHSRELTSSPLALIQKLHNPLSQLITSKQRCNYQFDNRGKHMTTATCTETHVYLPFSRGDRGISSVVTQEFSLQNVRRTNNRVFGGNPWQARTFHFEDPDEKAPSQTKDAVLSTLRDLADLAGTDQGRTRTSLYHKLVSNLRVLNNDTLSQMVNEMLGVSSWLTWHALFQCGTSECTSAILQIIRKADGVSLEVDALVYGLSLQSEPDVARVRDILTMAQYTQSKAIMYALANTVKKFHKGEVTPVVTDVAQFMETLLNDCSGEVKDDDNSDFPPDPHERAFLVLRVVGVMGKAMQDVSPGLKSSILRCAKNTDIPLSNQKAAIQALRLMSSDDEIRDALLEVYQDTQSPADKRVAAYLVLMKSVDDNLLRAIFKTLENESDEQVKNFVLSHLHNIVKSDEPGMYLAQQFIRLVLESLPSPSHKIFDRLSQNYKVDTPFGAIQSSILFDGRDTLPKEMMLEATLKALDYKYDIFEVGVEGTGFEPTIDALFGERGFFPEAISRIMYLAEDKVQTLRDVLSRIDPQQDRTKRQAPQDLLMGVADSFQKLMKEVRLSPKPEATAYFRLLGNEIGYLKTSEMRKMFETLFMYYHVFIRILPVEAFFALTSSTENEVFADYIFMENAFALPTASGFPLKFSLAGVFSLGAKGGLTPSAMTDLSFMPSVGLEFITQMGVYMPDHSDARIEMHTNLYHESSLTAKLTVNRNQVKLSIPAPTSNTQLLSVSNTLLSISSGQTTAVPSLVEDRTDSTDCQPLVNGLKLCTIMGYSNPTDQAPYYPLTGDTRFAIELQPTGTVSEYTATITDETVREGKKGRHKVETLKLTLRAEGEDATEAMVALKYNRNKNILSTDVVIPDYDVEAGIKLAVTGSNTDGSKMRGITIDVTNKNIPQLSLTGRTRLDKMRDAMLQLQMTIPSLKADASVTANLRKDEDIVMDLETVIHFPETSYQRKASLKYDNDKVEVELKSDLNADIQKMIPNLEDHHRKLQQLLDDVLDQRVAKTDMKLRHIVTKGIEAGNIWLDKLSARIPYLANLRSKRSSSDLTLPSLPEKLFFQSDSLFRYQFNKDRIAISIPLPLGGKKSEELNFPKTLSMPPIDVPVIGLNIPANDYPLPSFTVPPSLDFTVPLLGLAEASTKINSNFYSWEGSLIGGNNTVDIPSYVAQYKAMAQSPLNLLSYKLEGIGMMSGKADDNLKYLLNSSFSHSLIDTSFSVLETLRVTNKINARANYKMEASSPLGLKASLYYSAQAMSTLDSDEVSGDGTVEGLLEIGSLYNLNTSYTNSYNLRPLDQEGRGESTLHIDSTFIDLHNTIRGLYANSELNIVSQTSALKDSLKHVAELKYKDAHLTLKCNANGKAFDKLLNNKVELGVSPHMALFRIESQADDPTNRAYSLITGSLDSNGLEVNSEGSLTFDTGRGLHKASVKVGKNGLTTSGTNSIQCTPLTVENIFNGAIDNNGASLSCTTKAMGEEGRGEMNMEGKITAAEASLRGDLKGYAYDAATTNNMNMVLNRRGLTFTGDTKGTMRQMKTENSHELTLTLWTLRLLSKTDNVFCEDVYYKQDTKIDLKPFIMKSDMTNDLRFYDLRLNNEGHVKLEPVKVDLSGSLQGAYGDENNIKHSYELTYDDLAGTMKSSTFGNVMDAQLSHNCEFEFAGLSSTSNCEARINSEPLRFDGTIRTMALPFSFTVDALVKGDGEIDLLGKHTGQLASRVLLKAEPLALAYSEKSAVSTTHMLSEGRGETSSNLENMLEFLLTPSDQSLVWNVKSKLNEQVYNQDIIASNNPEKVGFTFSGHMKTDIFSKYKYSQPEVEDYSVSGSLMYDKNSDCHIIEIPFIESFPVAFEHLKNTFVQALESLQQFIYSLDIDQLITDFRARVDQLPVVVGDLMREMDLENKVDQVKAKLDYLINEFAVTMDDLELAVKNFRENLEKTITDFVTESRDLLLKVEDYIRAGHLADKITEAFSHLGNRLQDFDDRYKVKLTCVKVLEAIEDIIRQIDLQKLRDSTATFLRELDSKYAILETIKDKLSEIKKFIEDFDINMGLQDVKDYLLSIDWAEYIEQLSYAIPSSDLSRVMESMNDVIVNWIDEYEIKDKLNTVYSYVKDLFLKYGLDDAVKELMDQAVVLVNEFKIEETVQLIVNALKSVKFEFVYDKMMQLLDSVTSQLKTIDFRKSIDDLNDGISSLLKSMKEFDYGTFVDWANERISDLTNYINEQIKTYEIVRKIEAVREFFREIQTSIYTYLDELKNTKVADALKKLKDVIDTTFYNDVKLKVQDILDDMRQRIMDMDIRDEMYIHLKRASESYSNIVAFLSAQFNRLMEKIGDSEVIGQIKQAVDGALDQLKRAEIEIPTFTVPLTDLVIPAFTINLNKLHEISIPAQISLPEFTILNSYTIPAFTIDFDEFKAKIVGVIEDIKDFEIESPDPEDIFGDLKVLYLSELPDLTFPEITLSEIKFPAITIPKLNLNNFEITMLPIPEFKFPSVPSDICIPVFGKLHGKLNVNFPEYILEATGKIENSTSTPKNPQFTAMITSHAQSPIKLLEHTFEATAQLEAPRMKKLLFTENVKGAHVAFSIDHEGSLTLTGSSAEASAKTTAKATTPVYTADLINNMGLTLRSGIYATIDTTYDHNLEIPSIETSSQASMKQNIAATVESGKISVTGETTGNGKWSIQDYSDEGIHKSSVDFDVNLSTAKLTFVGETESKALKAKQALKAESESLSHITVEARCETELPSVKKSVAVVNGEAHIGDLKVELTAAHDAEFAGNLMGSMSNSLEFLAHPFEIVLDVKNKVNSKIFFPLKLTGKVDLQHDYCLVLNSEKQRACWFALGRFNQYKYSHNFTAENNDMDIVFQALANGEANLDFLTVPLSIPEITIPYLEITTPEVRDFPLWENAGFKTLLTTPQQSFDMNLMLQYHKNPDTHSYELHLEPIYAAITENVDILRTQFEACRDKVIALLKDSYNEAKAQYIKHKIDTSSLPPRIIRVPGYTIPILNIQVSSFRAELPAFSYIVPKEVSTPSFKIPALGFSVPSYILVLPSLKFPVIHVPETLSDITLPAFTLPAIQNNIVIPAMGNITFDFSFKSPVITLSTNAGLYNQPDIVARFSSSSASVFDILNGKIDGTTSLTRKRGIKLATTVSLEHNNLEANHECAVSLSKRSMEASVANTVRIFLPILNLEFNQELTGNTKTKPNVSSKKKLKYMFNIPLIESVGKGNLDMMWELEALSSYVSLEATTQGKSDITVMDSCSFAGDLENIASFYLNANGLRSTVRTVLNSNIDKQEKRKRSSGNNVFMFDLNKNLALEVSLRRVFATLDYMSNNNVDLASFNTNGKRVVKGELDFVPLTTLKTTLNIDASQATDLGDAGLNHNIELALSSEKQSFTWSGKEQLASLIHAWDLLMSNDESEVRVDLTGSVEGHLAFLKSVKLPVYQKNLWDVLKFDEVTNMDDLQVLNISSSIVYTKTMDGHRYEIPYTLFDNGISFSIPEVSIVIPSWVKEIPPSIRKIDMRFENPDVPDHLVIPPAISVPAFDVPFTNLHVEPFTIDPKNLDIPKVITTKAFEIKLPGFPMMSVPSYDIDTEYLQGKMSFLAFKIPQYEITVSSFTLPKSFTIGGHTVSLNDITNQISNFELPNIVIPEQKIEIPKIDLHLPSSVFIPAFGALSATLKVSSPIYNVSTTASVERKDSDLVTSLNSLCTSTMILLEYDLSASATIKYENGLINLNGKCKLIHNDVNVNWQHVLLRNMRMKRQTPQADSMEPRHTLEVDITSPTFVDVIFRMASRKDGITASVSSPSSGFLGLHLQRRSPSQLNGKLFSRYMSSAGKDVDVVTAKASLRNSEKLLLQVSWNWDFFHDVIESTKQRTPAITHAVLAFINKYHTYHFGFNVQRGSMKLKNTVSNVIERAYHEVPVTFNTLQDFVIHISNDEKNRYLEAADRLKSMSFKDIVNQVLKYSERKIKTLVDAVKDFLRDTMDSVVGSENRISIYKAYGQAEWSLISAIDRAIMRFFRLMKKISMGIRETEFTIPGTDAVVRGDEIMDHVDAVYEKVRRFLSDGIDWLMRSLGNLLRAIDKNAESILNFLKEKFMEIAPRVDAVHAKVVKTSKQLSEEAKRQVAEHKDLIKLKIQEAYQGLTMERVYTGVFDAMTIIQIQLYRGLYAFGDLMKVASESTSPYIKVSNKKMDVEIPLPFLWKSFNEWPTELDQ